MTIRQLVTQLGQQGWLLTGLFAGLPLSTILWGLLHPRDRSELSPWKYGYGLLVYLSCVPGIFSAILVGYALFFTGENLLDVNLLVYILPLISMLLTLSLIRTRLTFSQVPGFGRLSALMTLLGVSFALALAIDRTRIFVGFFGSIDRLLLLTLALFGLIRFSFWALFGKKSRPPAPTE